MAYLHQPTGNYRKGSRRKLYATNVATIVAHVKGVVVGREKKGPKYLRAAEMFHGKLDALMAQGLTAIDLERALPEVSRQTAQKWLKGDETGKRSVPDGINMLWLVQRFQWPLEDIVGAPEGPEIALGGAQSALGPREQELQRELASLRLERIRKAAAEQQLKVAEQGPTYGGTKRAQVATTVRKSKPPKADQPQDKRKSSGQDR